MEGGPLGLPEPGASPEGHCGWPSLWVLPEPEQRVPQTAHGWTQA